MISKLLREALGRLGVAGEDNDAAHGPIQAMRHAEIDSRRLGVFLFDVRLYHRFERRHTGRPLGEQWRWLVHGNEVEVFVENIHQLSVWGLFMFRVRAASRERET